MTDIEIKKMVYGYARTSTLKQIAGLEAQIKKLNEYGCDKIYMEQRSSVFKRPELEALCEAVKPGDEVVVCTLDRLARSMRHFEEIFSYLSKKKVSLRILNLGFDFGSPTGKLMLQLLMSFAEFERTNMLERQRAGLERARENGKLGRKMPEVKEKKIKEAIEHFDPEVESIPELAKELRVSVPTIYKRIKKYMPELKTKRQRKQQIINDRFNGDSSAYKMYRMLARMSAGTKEKIKGML